MDSPLLLPKIRTIPQFVPLYDPSNPFYRARFLTFYGGRGARKSWEIARSLLIKGIRRTERILCTREYQNSIDESVLSLLEDQAKAIGLWDFYEFQRTTILSRINDTEFFFAGMRTNPKSIKSKEGITIVWNEEAEDTSRKSWEILEPTIRKPGSQIITSFNTGSEEDFIYKTLVTNHDPKDYLCKVLYTDNPDASPELIEAAEKMQKRDPERYANIYLGEPWSRSDAQVLSGKWRVDRLDIEGADGPYYGLDFGFSVDPSAFTRSFIFGRDPKKGGGILYIHREAYQKGVEIDDYPKFLEKVPGARDHKIRADSARPDVISHIKRKGFNISGARKGEGSVEDGVSLLRSFDEIVIDPDCKNTIQEARRWRYKVDRQSGDVLPVLVDQDNHAWDSIRYALEPLTKPTKDISMRIA